jgi:predicted glycosyl hydrolase (DUF1957 family)
MAQHDASGYLALVLEFHHPAPAPETGDDWAWSSCAVETYWPLMRAISNAAESGLNEVVTVAVSPIWTAFASDPETRLTTLVALEQRQSRDAMTPRAESWRTLRSFIERWHADPLGPLKGAYDKGTIEIICATSSPTWLPSIASEPTLIEAQFALAALDHSRVFGRPSQGVWLPHLSYAPGIETAIARSGTRYFGVDAWAFRRGMVHPPLEGFAPLVTSPGAAAFGVEHEPVAIVTAAHGRFAFDPRYADPAQSLSAADDHAAHLVSSWARWTASRAGRDARQPPICVVRLSAHDLGSSWPGGAAWLERVFHRLADSDRWMPTTLSRYLDRFPEGPLGRPAACAGGWLSARPAGADLFSRIRESAPLLQNAIEHRHSLTDLGRRAVAQMCRSLLLAQSLDWNIPPGSGISPDEGLARANLYLHHVHELAAHLSSGTLDPARLALMEGPIGYLPEIDLDVLADP